MLTINTNLSSLVAQSSLKTSTNRLNQAIERMTTGFKINHASDNAAGYSISTNMSSKLSSYEVAMDNASMGLDMITTATDSMELITSHLQRMRDLAEQAANGTYGKDSLNAIQAEIDARTAEVGRIVNNTEYNGIKFFGQENTTNTSPISTFSAPQKSAKASQITVDESKRIVNQTTFTAGETYYVTNSDDLVKLQDLVNSGVDTTDVTFELTSDIDMRGVAFRGIGTYGEKSHPSDETKAFKGNFNGNNFTISNLIINTNEDYVGLFGCVQNGIIDSLKIENCDMFGREYVAGLVGKAVNTTINHCSVTGNIGNYDYFAGGILGLSDGNCTIINCSAIVNVYANTGSVTEAIGGLIGASLSSSDFITNCFSAGKIQGNYEVGGLIGSAGGTITNCFSSAEVLVHENSGSNIGGLVGTFAKGTISSSYATGNVNGSCQTGGLVGDLMFDGTNIINCYATGNVKGTDGVGGLIGGRSDCCDTGYIQVMNCYSTGNVVGVSNVGAYFGSIYNGDGKSNNIKINGYFDIQTAGQTIGVGNSNYTGTVTGVTTAELNELINNGTLPQYNYDSNTPDNDNSGSDGNSPDGNQGGADGGVTGGGSTSGNQIPGGGTGGGNNSIFGGSYEVTLQVGINSDPSSTITIDIGIGKIELNIDVTTADGARDALTTLDEYLKGLNEKQTQLGAAYNRLESVIESIGINIDNLVSSRSNLRDADIAELSSTYIQQQILQQASATLLATANQSPSVALQLLQFIDFRLFRHSEHSEESQEKAVLRALPSE